MAHPSLLSLSSTLPMLTPAAPLRRPGGCGTCCEIARNREAGGIRGTSSGASLTASAVVAGREPRFPAEDLGEVAGVGIADVHPHAGDAGPVLPEQALRLVHAKGRVIAGRGYPGSALEEAVEVELAQARLGGKLV